MKKVLSLLIAIIMCVGMVAPAMASTKEQMYIIPEQGTWVNSTVTTILDDAETKNYEQYELNPDSLTFRKAS